MKRQILVNIIKECIEEILNESRCNCDSVCKCGDLNIKNEELSIANDIIINSVLEKYPYADDDVVKKYIKDNPKGVSIHQFEKDAKSQKWTIDTVRAIATILKKLKK